MFCAIASDNRVKGKEFDPALCPPLKKGSGLAGKDML